MEKPNLKLAEEFLRLSSCYPQTAIGLKIYQKQAAIIENLELDLTEYFKQNNSFDKLKSKGIGSETKRRLELILTKGSEEAVKLMIDKKLGKYNAIYSSPKIKNRRKTIEETSANFENNRRHLEENL